MSAQPMPRDFDYSDALLAQAAKDPAQAAISSHLHDCIETGKRESQERHAETVREIGALHKRVDGIEGLLRWIARGVGTIMVAVIVDIVEHFLR